MKERLRERGDGNYKREEAKQKDAKSRVKT